VAVFEHGGGWHHIHSEWLGDCWVYQVSPEDDPAAYTPPAVVTPEHITGIKRSHQYELGGGGWRNSPFDITIVVMNGEIINPEAYFSIGQEVGIRYEIKNASQDQLKLNPQTTFQIDITRQLDNGNGVKPELIWSGEIPASKAVFKSGESEELTFSWDQKDSEGKQVPFGTYNVQIKLPMTIGYTKLGMEQQLQEQQAQAAILTHFPLRISAP
jgi:hypothetical protein